MEVGWCWPASQTCPNDHKEVQRMTKQQTNRSGMVDLPMIQLIKKNLSFNVVYSIKVVSGLK